MEKLQRQGCPKSPANPMQEWRAGLELNQRHADRRSEADESSVRRERWRACVRRARVSLVKAPAGRERLTKILSHRPCNSAVVMPGIRQNWRLPVDQFPQTDRDWSLRHRRGCRRGGKDQRVLCQPCAAAVFARARDRRDNPRRAVAGGGDAGATDATFCGFVERAKGGPGQLAESRWRFSEHPIRCRARFMIRIRAP